MLHDPNDPEPVRRPPLIDLASPAAARRAAPWRLCALLLVATNGSTDDWADGRRAYAEGRFADALAAFTAAEQAAGDEVSAALLYNKALAALRADTLNTAEGAADKAATLGGAEFTALRDFLRGNVAFARSAAAAKQAGSVESEPFAFDAALALGESARNAWQAAAMSRPDWPAARRNAERAVRWLEQLQAQKAAADDQKSKAKKEPDAPKPKLPPPDENKKPEPEKPPTDELSRDEVRRLLDKLAAKEREKVRLRRSQQQAASIEVQRDW